MGFIIETIRYIHDGEDEYMTDSGIYAMYAGIVILLTAINFGVWMSAWKR